MPFKLLLILVNCDISSFLKMNCALIKVCSPLKSFNLIVKAYMSGETGSKHKDGAGQTGRHSRP